MYHIAMQCNVHVNINATVMLGSVIQCNVMQAMQCTAMYLFSHVSVQSIPIRMRYLAVSVLQVLRTFGSVLASTALHSTPHPSNPSAPPSSPPPLASPFHPFPSTPCRGGGLEGWRARGGWRWRVRFAISVVRTGSVRSILSFKMSDTDGSVGDTQRYAIKVLLKRPCHYG